MAYHLLFVYGTLKRGYRNNHRLAKARFVGTGYTDAKFLMWDVGFPMVVRSRRGNRIEGEFYVVDDATLAACDRLEGHPNFYRRQRARVFWIDHKRAKSAWIYVRPQFDRERYQPMIEPNGNGMLHWEGRGHAIANR